MGYELEFIGLSLEQAAKVVQTAMGGSLNSDTAAHMEIVVDPLGTFGIEVDWEYLKNKAKKAPDEKEYLQLLKTAASILVPIEVVCPPLPMDRMHLLNPLTNSLHRAGARGTDDSIFAAFGVHINADIPQLAAAEIDAYLKAFCLLQNWLVKAHDVDLSRRLTRYIDLYPDAYLKTVIFREDPNLDVLFDDYLEHNPTRNRALDMLPLLMEIDADRVSNRVKDSRIKARPTFHYRLPNCMIGSADWTLSDPWNIWWTVEELAANRHLLTEMCDAYRQEWRPLTGVNENDWLEKTERWLKENRLA